ncbi:hypothetical protein ACI6Q2_08935 [Chitinophagaceae bacterium LWZ2-11]
MLRQITAIFFLLAFLAQTFNRAVITLEFYANQKYIAKNLCENRAKPELNCCGKCQLKKRLNKEENKDKQMPERRFSNSEEVLSSKSFFATVQPFQVITKKQYAGYNVETTIDISTEFFHPPGA